MLVLKLHSINADGSEPTVEYLHRDTIARFRKVACWYVGKEQSGTRIHFRDGGFMDVVETPEQVTEMIIKPDILTGYPSQFCYDGVEDIKRKMYPGIQQNAVDPIIPEGAPADLKRDL